MDVEKEPGWEPRKGGNGKIERIIRSKKYLLLPTLEEVKKTEFSPIPGHKNYEGRLANSWLGVPMIAGGKVLGVIANYDYGKDNIYNEDDIEILQALAGYAAIAIDNVRISRELEQRATELAKVNEELKELDRRKSEFLSIVSHELRTPLTSIKSCIENMLARIYGTINENQRNGLETALASVEDEARLVENLLDLVRIQENRVSLYLEIENVSDIINSVIQVFDYDAREKKIELLNFVI